MLYGMSKYCCLRFSFGQTVLVRHMAASFDSHSFRSNRVPDLLHVFYAIFTRKINKSSMIWFDSCAL